VLFSRVLKRSLICSPYGTDLRRDALSMHLKALK